MGDYSVTLYFAQTSSAPRFDVRLEDSAVLVDYEPQSRAETPTSQSFTTEVVDGRLDIELVCKQAVARISAIEVETLEGDQGVDRPVAVVPEELRDQGRPEEAVARVEQAFALGITTSRRLWHLWWTLRAVDLGHSPETLHVALAEFLLGPGVGPGDELRWALDQLLTTGAVRINCGNGPEYRGRSGEIWGTDRFVLGGWTAYGGDLMIEATEDDPLYYRRRYFPSGERVRAYRLPVPPGEYRVRIHFAECNKEARTRSFDVFLEETTVAEDYSAHDSGFRTADILEIEVDVADGFVDVHFGRRDENPNIAAIEVIRKDG